MRRDSDIDEKGAVVPSEGLSCCEREVAITLRVPRAKEVVEAISCCLIARTNCEGRVPEGLTETRVHLESRIALN